MQTSRATSKVHAAGMQPQADQFEEWHPMHLHEVVAVTMVIKNWMRPRDRAVERQKREEKSAINELNTSMVFEPMPITMERIRMLKQLGRTPSSSSLIRSTGGGGIGPDSNSKMSSATSAEILPSPVAVVQDAGQPTLLQMESTPQRQPTEPLPPIRLPTPNTNRNNNIRKTQEHQQQQATGAETSPNHQMASNGRAGGDGHNRTEPTESNTTVGQERGLLGEGRRILIPSRKAVADCLRAASRAFMALPNVSVQPTGKFYAYWTFLIYLAFLYNAFVAVLFVFDDTQANTFFGLWLILNALTDCINLTDLFLNSRLSYMDDGVLVKDWRRLTKRYLHNWHFPLDLFALFPSDLLLLLNRNFSLVRVNRLAKCYRVWEFVQMTNVRTNYPNAFRILHIVVVCMVLFHWNAALYFKISLFHGIFTTDPSAWEFNYVKNQDPIWVRCGQVLWDQIPEGTCGFNESGRGDPDTERVNYLSEMISYWKDRSFPLHFSNFSKQYSLSFYWSSLTLTTSGQQPYPTAAMHNFLEIFDTIVGVLVFAVIVGSVGNVVTTMNRGRAEIQQLNDGIKFYMNYRHVSDAMQKRVLDCIHYIQRHAQIQNEESIMAAIPPRLQGELAVHLHMETLRQADLFAEADPALLYELVLRLRMQMFAPNDFLCRRGDLAKEMYVLKRGVLEVLDEQGEQTRFGQGNIFGEMSILKAGGQAGKLLARRRHCLRSVGYSEVYLLSQEDALDVFADYPEQRQQLIQRATDILLENGHVQPQELLERGPFSPLELCGTETGSEVLQLLKDTLEGLDHQLDGLYTKFTKNSAELKQQMTALETDYRETRLLKKEQKRKNARGKKNGEAIVKEK